MEDFPVQLRVIPLNSPLIMKSFCLSVILAVIVFFGVKVAFPEVDFSWFYQSAPRIQGRFSNVIVFSGKIAFNYLQCHAVD